jgi:hypothetical protein
MVFVGVCCVVQENWRLEIMGRYGAELMRRSKQWRQAVGDGWNGVEDFQKASGGSQRRFLVAWKKIRGIIFGKI